MNIERALSIFESVFEELNSGTVSTFQSLVVALSGQTSQPQNPAYQQQVSTHLINLKKILNNVPSNNYSPAWRLALQELDFEKYLGKKLLNSIETIFEKNAITLVVAQQELQQLSDAVSSIKESLSQIIQAAKKLNLKKEDLQPGECEVGFTIPRLLIKNHMNELIKELKEIEKIMLVFEEITTGHRSDIELRTISSSDPTFFFYTVPGVAACIVYTVDKILDLYKKYLEIKKLGQDLKNNGFTEQDLAVIQKKINSSVEEGIKELVPEIIKEYIKKEISEHRRNELTIELTKVSRKIADKIDRGLQIEVRAKPLVNGSEKLESEEKQTESKFISFVNEKASTINYIKSGSDPILCLSKHDDEECEKKENEAKEVTNKKGKTKK